MTYKVFNSRFRLALIIASAASATAVDRVGAQGGDAIIAEQRCTEDVAPYLAEALAPKARRLMQIAGLQAWLVTRKDGERAVVMTTDDCLTVEGRVVGPHGENLTGALVRVAVAADLQASGAELDVPSPEMSREAQLRRTAATQRQAHPPTEATPFAEALATSPRYQGDTAVTSDRPWAAPERSVSPVDAIAQQLPPPARNAAELIQQATDVAMWFQAGTPQPNAPTVFLVADPHCPHCADAIEALAPSIAAGKIDLRVILVAIVSQDSFGTSISVIQSDDPGSTFVAHEVASASATASPLTTLDPSDHDPDVVVALARNVLWLRANDIPGVPFWLYATTDGARHGMGPWQDEIASSALPLPASSSLARTPEATR